MTVSLWTLCQGKRDAPLSIEVFDWDDNSAADLIGVATFTVNDMCVA